MKNWIAISSLLLVSFISLKAQNNSLDKLCDQLDSSIYIEDFDFDKISSNFDAYAKRLETVDQEEYNSCNCADTLWLKRANHTYQLSHITHTISMDTLQYLNNISQEIDECNLNTEMRLHHLEELNDSLNYVINRLKIKSTGGKYLYNLIGAEMNFLKAKRAQLQTRYFEIIDDVDVDPHLADKVLSALFNSNNEVAVEIEKRIVKPQYERYFFRMYGILNTSSKKRSLDLQICILENLEYGANQEILDYLMQSFYGPAGLHELRSKHKRALKRMVINKKFNDLASFQKLMKQIQ